MPIDEWLFRGVCENLFRRIVGRSSINQWDAVLPKDGPILFELLFVVFLLIDE